MYESFNSSLARRSSVGIGDVQKCYWSCTLLQNMFCWKISQWLQTR